MDELEEKFKKLEDEGTRPGFHTRVVGYILDKKLKAPFYTLIILSSVNLLFSVWNLWARLEEKETLSAIGAGMEGFSPTSDFLSNIFTTLKESFPGHAFTLFIFNLIFVAYAAYLVFRMKKFTERKVVSN